MTDGSVLRAYAPGDLEACRALWVELTQRHRDIYEDPALGGDDPGRQFDAYLARDDLVGPWVLEVDGAVVGLTGLLVEGTEAEIEPVVVTAAHRSRGLGTRLLEHARAEAVARGMTHLSVRPVGRNAAAMACFHRAGFDILGRVELFTELRPGRGDRWKPGVTLHGLGYRS